MRRHLPSLAASTSILALMLATGAHADQFINGTFEDGTLNGWTVGGGSWFGGPYPVPSDYLPGGANYVAGAGIATVTNTGTDSNTDNVLRTVYGGNHSAQVNNDISDYSVSTISQRVNNYTDPKIEFAYSAVLQQSHGPTDSDAFIVTLVDATTNEVVYSYNLNSATAPGVFVESSTGWYYTDWLTASIDVSGRQGHDFILSLLANDCPYGAHAGYAYLDGFGAVVGGGGSSPVQYWNGAFASPNGQVNGGDGVWTASATNWTDSAGSASGTYSPTPIFAGQPGTVTVDNSAGQVSIAGAQFAVSGYAIVGQPIELSGIVADIAVGDGTAAGAGYLATIDAPLFGTAGLTKQDFGTLVLNGVNTYTGTTTVEAGTLVGSATSFGSGAIYDNATLIVNQPTSATMANPLGGTGTFIKTGAGELLMTANSPFAGATAVAEGLLRVDGSLASSSVTVSGGAALGGYGTVGNVTALAGSTIAPGGSIGTLNVAGNYVQQAGSTYQAEVTGAGASDLLAVTGSATLEPGSVLDVVKLDSTPYQLGYRYTVVSADGGVNGTYAVTGDTDVSLFYSLVAAYDPTHVYLDVLQTSPFASAGFTPNQRAAAAGADSLGTGTLHDAIGNLQTVGEARAAFDAISGEINASGKGVLIEDSRFLRNAMLSRIDATFDEPAVIVTPAPAFPTKAPVKAPPGIAAPSSAFWAYGFGSWGSTNGNGNAAGLDRSIGGFFIGADTLVAESWRVGVVGGYSQSSFDVDSRHSSGESDNYHIGAYAGTLIGNVGLKFGGAYTWSDVTTRRFAGFTGFSDSLHADYDAGTAQVFAEAGYRFALGGATLEPIANVAYVNLHTDGFTEQGGPAALRSGSATDDLTYTTLGLRASSRFELGTMAATARGLIGWRHAFGDTTPDSVFAFSGGTPFSIEGAPIAEDALVLDAGLDFALTESWTLSANYGGQFGGGFEDQTVKGSLTLKF
ncbi:autotransporter domain-containing protein [Ancylobacter sp. 6x-1]|uniref:Autotransporter domain-containing protein n=1 Tax=Ancylobacter crimeensis TaxID=2579147 RepID=A0ABT0D8B7_9HYPH|nr:autotransporter domain-containing protein [Ancylobacter crimeensis]MCK0196164.1 autotransporter domain-containing protein [Ancylobacter crimeensis]